MSERIRAFGRLKQAITRQLALEPNLAEAHNNLGTTLQELGRLEEAKAEVEAIAFIETNFLMEYEI